VQGAAAPIEGAAVGYRRIKPGKLGLELLVDQQQGLQCPVNIAVTAGDNFIDGNLVRSVDSVDNAEDRGLVARLHRMAKALASLI
jgi:hypothetical protein